MNATSWRKLFLVPSQKKRQSERIREKRTKINKIKRINQNDHNAVNKCVTTDDFSRSNPVHPGMGGGGGGGRHCSSATAMTGRWDYPAKLAWTYSLNTDYVAILRQLRDAKASLRSSHLQCFETTEKFPKPRENRTFSNFSIVLRYVGKSCSK